MRRRRDKRGREGVISGEIECIRTPSSRLIMSQAVNESERSAFNESQEALHVTVARDCDGLQSATPIRDSDQTQDSSLLSFLRRPRSLNRELSIRLCPLTRS